MKFSKILIIVLLVISFSFSQSHINIDEITTPKENISNFSVAAGKVLLITGSFFIVKSFFTSDKDFASVGIISTISGSLLINFGKNQFKISK